jgi:hypothetical protein
MSKEGLLLQRDMFTGRLVDNRSAYRKRQDKALGLPRQMGMFPLKETLQFGVQARPWLNDLPRPQMVLQQQDVRTDEEKERDLLREAEDQTADLFADSYGTVAPVIDPETPSTVIEPISPVESIENSPPDNTEAYLELVQIVKEQALTLWIDETYRKQFYSQLPVAILNAHAAGMTASEITVAMQEGDAAGQREKAETQGNVQPFNVKKHVGETDKRIRLRKSTVEGRRAKVRRSKVPIRVRSRRQVGC